MRMNDPSSTVVTVTAPVTTPLPVGFDTNDMMQIAREIAMGILGRGDIYRQHNLSLGQVATLEALPVFQRLVEGQVAEWGAIGSTKKRLQLQAAAGLEAGLPDVAARLKNNTEPLVGVVGVAKLLAEMSGVVGNEAAKAGGIGAERVHITINLGEDKKLTFDKSAAPRIISGEISEDGEGKGDGSTTRVLPETT